MTEIHTPRPAPRRRSDGQRSRDAILHEAARLATTEGISGLSIARLADAVGMSKSGLFAHFGSKEELQLATIDTAHALFHEHVIDPAQLAPNGIERLRSLLENYLSHIEHHIFPGGCFWASVVAEVDMHPGPVRDGAIQVVSEWLGQIESAIRDAQAEGAIDPSEDHEQLTYELESFVLCANTYFVIMQERTPLDRARRAIDRRLALRLPPPEVTRSSRCSAGSGCRTRSPADRGRYVPA
jgi:AcrR family transcriptional regulator